MGNGITVAKADTTHRANKADTVRSTNNAHKVTRAEIMNQKAINLIKDYAKTAGKKLDQSELDYALGNSKLTYRDADKNKDFVLTPEEVEADVKSYKAYKQKICDWPSIVDEDVSMYKEVQLVPMKKTVINGKETPVATDFPTYTLNFYKFRNSGK